MVIVRTPYRISMLGGASDHQGWFSLHGGCVLSTTIDKYCYLLVKKNVNFFDYKYKISYRIIENVNSLDELKHDTFRECVKLLGIYYGLEVYHAGDLPARSGMGSSSAFAVGALNSLYALEGKYVDKKLLAEQAIEVERVKLGEVGGWQDQIAVAYGGFNKITFNTNGNFHVSPIPISGGRLSELQDHLMLFYLKAPRTASDIASTFVPDIDSKRRQLRISQNLVEEGIQVLCSDQDIRLFGELLHEYWEMKRSLSDKVSSSKIDKYYQIAKDTGAIGGKILGAGGGGFLLIFAEPKYHDKIKEALNNLLHVPFGFENTGSSIIFRG